MNKETIQGNGPLRVHQSNLRYFTDDSGRAIYLTGSHTWSNFKDMGRTDPPPPFDFDGYLDFLERHGHNFIRLWTWELSTYTYDGRLTYATPFPWLRTGPGNALDGKPKFDLDRLDERYFERLRERVQKAGERGMYVSVMLFEGHGLHASLTPWCWDGHPFNSRNNINGIEADLNGDGRGIESQTLQIPEVVERQEIYVRAVIDALSDLDNLLYEIGNEIGSYSTEWQYHMIRFIKAYEQKKPKQHPVGMTFQFAREQRGTNTALFESPADWISPNPEGGYRDNPPPADGSKVILSDTDHLWGIGGNVSWVWKSFCRGLNPLFMDPYREPEKSDGNSTTWTDHLSDAITLDQAWDPIRKNLGYTRRYAERMDLAAALPRTDLASTGYCLANPGVEYLVYQPEHAEFTLDLTGTNGALSLEWFSPVSGETRQEMIQVSGKVQEFSPPFEGGAVLYLNARSRTDVRVYPTETDELLANPGMGWQTFHRFADEDPNLEGLPSASAYFRFYWRELEPTEGEIDFPMLDRLLTRAREAGQKLAFRVMCVGTDRESIHVPEWLREKGCPGFEFRYEDRGPTRWAPDMDDPIFQEAHFRLIRKLGTRYDSHPDIDLIDIGTVGLWGEWHMSSTGVAVPSLETRLKIIDLYCEAFPTTPKVMLIGDADGMRHAIRCGCGWRADCLGDMGGFSETWNHMEHFYRQQLAKTEGEDAWRTAPVAFESCWDMRKWHDEGWDIRFIFDYALDLHASYLNNKSAPLPEGTRDEIERFLRRIGYRLVLREASYPAEVVVGNTLPLAMLWENIGVAPPYRGYHLAVRLHDARHTHVIRSEASIRGWLPGERRVEERLNLSDSIPAGSYEVSLGFLDPHTGQPAIRLAITGRDAEGWYPIGRVTVRTHT